MHQLHPFTPSPTAEPFQVFCELDFFRSKLQVRYRVQGPLDELILPPSVDEPQFRDELWMTTCLEVFLQRAGQAAYDEWNFSPSGNWAHYRFAGYRQRADAEPRLTPLALPAQHWMRNDQSLLLQLAVPIDRGTDPSATFHYGLTAVLHLKNGEKQYWALHHAGDKPDFHLPASFVGRELRSDS